MQCQVLAELNDDSNIITHVCTSEIISRRALASSVQPEGSVLTVLRSNIGKHSSSDEFRDEDYDKLSKEHGIIMNLLLLIHYKML